MDTSIQHFEKNGIPNLEKITKTFMDDPMRVSEFVVGVKDAFLQTALEYIGETFTAVNEVFRNSSKRVEDWEVVDTRDATKTTSIGDVNYRKTLFKHKKTGERKFLVDIFFGFEPHSRLTEDAIAKMLEEAVQTSYRKAGEECSILRQVSKQTVKNHIHALKFPEAGEMEASKEKRVVKRLYIEADEDHVHLQFQDKKGDLETSKTGRKRNGAIEKIVYVHEGIEREAPKSKRHRLIGTHYFSGAYDGEKNKDLWDEVYEYINNTYDIDKIEKIYLCSDGGEWIKAGRKRLHGLTHVLDEFHIRQCLIRMTRHVDGIDKNDHAAMNALITTIKDDTKEDFKSYVDMLLFKASGNDGVWKRVSDGADYILNNWTAAKIRLTYKDKVCGCSTEGHVYHVLSSRMSTKPLGWSRLGADNMAHLRAYYWNGMSMLELVRYQREANDHVIPKAAGAENDVISAAKVIASEHLDVPDWAGYYERMQATISDGIKKSVRFAMYRSRR